MRLTLYTKFNFFLLLKCYREYEEEKPNKSGYYIFPLNECSNTLYVGRVDGYFNWVVMGRITLKIRNSLVQLLKELHQSHPRGVLIYGYCKESSEVFCKVVNLQKCYNRLLSCTRIQIAHYSHFANAACAFCSYLKGVIKTQPHAWWNLVSPSRWIEYNICNDLYILCLGVGSVDYYILLRREYLMLFRNNAFGYG